MTEAERILIRTRLTKAETAYDELLTGKAVKRFVDQNGETVEYTVANAEKLEDYIQSLKDCLNPIAAAFRRPRAIGFTF
jgi:hypothetical protein